METFVLLFKSALTSFFFVLHKNTSNIPNDITRKGRYLKLPFLAINFSSYQVKVETLPLVLPAAEIQTVVGFHPREVQYWSHHLLHQSNVQSDQKPFGKFPDFHDFEEIRFYPGLLTQSICTKTKLLLEFQHIFKSK